MKHAGPDTIAALADLLAEIRRAAPRLVERSPGVFYLKGRAALHFHEDPAGVFADLRLPGDGDWRRLRVAAAAEREALVAVLGGALG